MERRGQRNGPGRPTFDLCARGGVFFIPGQQDHPTVILNSISPVPALGTQCLPPILCQHLAKRPAEIRWSFGRYILVYPFCIFSQRFRSATRAPRISDRRHQMNLESNLTLQIQRARRDELIKPELINERCTTHVCMCVSVCVILCQLFEFSKLLLRATLSLNTFTGNIFIIRGRS